MSFRTVKRITVLKNNRLVESLFIKDIDLCSFERGHILFSEAILGIFNLKYIFSYLWRYEKKSVLMLP